MVRWSSMTNASGTAMPEASAISSTMFSSRRSQGSALSRHVQRDSAEPWERRLLNIVEEMALASGIAVPLAFVMDDQRTINAFAAGYSPHQAAVIVTRGAL